MAAHDDDGSSMSAQSDEHSLDRYQTNGASPDETELNRIQTNRLQHQSTVGSVHEPRGTENRLPIGAGKPYPPSLVDSESYIVEFDGADDPLHPMNWSTGKKLNIASILAFATFTCSFASAIFSATLSELQTEFNISEEVGTLGITLYVLGFASGPVLWAPLSELKGRQIPILAGTFGYCIFTIACGVAKDVQTLMICRFFGGLFAASALTVVPAIYSDMYDNRHRGTAVSLYAMAVFMGPFSSPFIGGFITMSYLGWRWTMYISAIMGFLALGLLALFMDESYAPTILAKKAALLRRQTRNWAIHAKQEEVEVNMSELITKNFGRPFKMLITEPVVLLMTIYTSFIYGLMYGFLDAYPIVFQGVHRMNLGVGSLPFFALMIGEMLGGIYVIVLQKPYQKKLIANNNIPVPEWRLMPAVVGGIFFTLGIFWLGWTGFTASIHWMAPTASGVFVGFGLQCIFLQCFNYLIDSYLNLAASVFAANTILRSAVGAVFPLFTRQMFNNLGIQWAGTLLGCLSAIMIPIPLGFIYFGPRLREMSKMAPSPFTPTENKKQDV